MPSPDRALTGLERRWILYDVANSAFVLTLATTLMPAFFKEVVAPHAEAAASTAAWGFAASFTSLVMAILAPFLGALADLGQLRGRLFAIFVGLGVLTTMTLSLIGPGDALLCLVLFSLARLGFGGANIFYDASLVEVTRKERMDWVSSAGFAWGYLGSVIPFLAALATLFLWPRADGAPLLGAAPMKVVFFLIAFWWGGLSIPFLMRAQPPAGTIRFNPGLLRESVVRNWRTLRSIRENRNIFLFLGAYFLYIDAVDSVITMAMAYGTEIGFSLTTLILVILMIQLVAFPCAFLYGFLASKWGARKVLHFGIGTYVVITFLAFLLPDLTSPRLQSFAFWTVGFLVATAQGGIQALSRSVFGRIIPKERAAEYFGFFNIFSRFATILGPALIGLLGTLTGHSRYGVLLLVLLLVAGGLLLRKVELPEAA